jgi:hypothetical protein
MNLYDERRGGEHETRNTHQTQNGILCCVEILAAVRANARMKLRVLGTLLGRSNDTQHNSATREEARFRKAEWDNYLRHGPRAQAEYHHGFEHCI